LFVDQPIVISVIAIILIGCSNDVKRKALSAICPKEAKPREKRNKESILLTVEYDLLIQKSNLSVTSSKFL
jgi:hypothetical protein